MLLQNINYGIVGLGIMGGSFAKAIKENLLCLPGAEGKIFACDRNEFFLKEAEANCVIDQGYSPADVSKMLAKCDFVIVCLYPSMIVEFLKEHKNDFKKGSIVTDISGVKSIYKGQFESFVTEDYDFILGHPMAGGEKEGFSASKGEFFKNHNYILIPSEHNKKENLETFRDLIRALGFSKITESDIDTHDNKIGFTSQLCHVVASAMVLTAPDVSVTSFGGGSFEDLTRIALINAPLWTELFLENKEQLLPHIQNLEKALAEFEKMISEGDKDRLNDCLTFVRNRRQIMATK